MWFWKKENDIGIDLGTSTVIIYIKNKGVVLMEPSVVAINNDTNKVLAVGEEAKNMIGRTPGNITAIRPLRDGVISNYEIAEKMLKLFMKKACGKRKIVASNVMVCVPSRVTEVERRAVINAAKSSGAKKVHVIEEPLAASMGAGLEILKPDGNMIVDIGGGTTDIAVISLGGIVTRESIKVAGDKLDEAIKKYVKNTYRIAIGEKTAEQIKILVGSAYDDGRKVKTFVKGRNLVTGLPDEIEISSCEIRKCIQDIVLLIVNTVKSILEKTPPELSADIIEQGIWMTGGGSLLYGLDKLIEEHTGIEVKISDNTVEAVAIGTGTALDYVERFDKSVQDGSIEFST